MNIYVDYDDCLSETGRTCARLAAELFQSRVPYEEMKHFELEKSFGLDEEQLRLLLDRVHAPEELLAYEETPGASSVLREWVAAGHQVSVITGRPADAYEASRGWLDRHGLEQVPLYCLNKYGRDSFYENAEYNLSLEDFYRMKFDIAVEDSPKAFRFFDAFPDLQVLVFDRPWNRDCSFPNEKYTRCFSWEDIRQITARH